MQQKVILELLSQDFTSGEIAEQLELNLRYVQRCIQKLKERGNHKTIYGMIAHYERRKINAHATQR